MDGLDRFKRAQEHAVDGFDTALSELQSGQKRSHWIWYIFPQLAGMGHSPMAVRYGLQGAAEAMDYLRDPVLRERLLAVTRAVAMHLEHRPGPALDELLGSKIDALKTVSCMTLFRGVACRLSKLEPLPDYVELAKKADAILSVAAEQGFPECASTRRQLGG